MTRTKSRTYTGDEIRTLLLKVHAYQLRLAAELRDGYALIVETGDPCDVFSLRDKAQYLCATRSCLSALETAAQLADHIGNQDVSHYLAECGLDADGEPEGE